MYLSRIPKSRGAAGENENTYTQRALDYGQGARHQLKPIHNKGKAKREQDGKHSEDNHLQMVSNRTESPGRSIQPGKQKNNACTANGNEDVWHRNY
jgi:hypothetical protein